MLPGSRRAPPAAHQSPVLLLSSALLANIARVTRAQVIVAKAMERLSQIRSENNQQDVQAAVVNEMTAMYRARADHRRNSERSDVGDGKGGGRGSVASRVVRRGSLSAFIGDKLSGAPRVAASALRPRSSISCSPKISPEMSGVRGGDLVARLPPPVIEETASPPKPSDRHAHSDAAAGGAADGVANGHEIPTAGAVKGSAAGGAAGDSVVVAPDDSHASPVPPTPKLIAARGPANATLEESGGGQVTGGASGGGSPHAGGASNAVVAGSPRVGASGDPAAADSAGAVSRGRNLWMRVRQSALEAGVAQTVAEALGADNDPAAGSKSDPSLSGLRSNMGGTALQHTNQLNDLQRTVNELRSKMNEMLRRLPPPVDNGDPDETIDQVEA